VDGVFAQRPIRVDCVPVLLDEKLDALVRHLGQFVDFIVDQLVSGQVVPGLGSQLQEPEAEPLRVRLLNDVFARFERRQMAVDRALSVLELVGELGDRRPVMFHVFDGRQKK